MRHAEHMLSNWANPDYDTALILTAVTGNITSPYAQHIREFIQEYSSATGQISYVSVISESHQSLHACNGCVHVVEWTLVHVAPESGHRCL